MKSNLDIANFKRRLADNVVIGNPQFIGWPLSAFLMLIQENRLFYGEHTDGNFQITWRKLFRPVSFVIKGAFTEINSTTELTYEVKRIWPIYLVRRIIPSLLIIVVNIIFFIESEPLESFLILNSVGIIINCLILLHDYISRKNLEKEFCEIFEIEKE